MKQITKEQVLEKLRSVNDPELRINVVDLGLIYETTISEKNDITVVMTVTTPGCPIIDQFLEQVHEQIESLEGVGKITVKLTFDPPWSVDKIKPELREALGM